MFHMALGETAVLGAFVAQDLALFVLFFDLMLMLFDLPAASGAGRQLGAGHEDGRDPHARRARC